MTCKSWIHSPPSTVCLWILTLFLLDGAVYGQSTARLFDTAVDQASAPLPGAFIGLASEERALRTESDKDGNFEFANLPRETYVLQVSKEAFITQKRSIVLSEDLAEPLVIALKVVPPCGAPRFLVYYGPPGSTNGRLAGFVKTKDKKPLANANVELWHTGDRIPAFRSSSDKEGRYVLNNLPAGYYDLRISWQGYWKDQRNDLLVPSENSVFVNYRMTKMDGRITVCE